MLKAQLNQTTTALEKLKAESALTKQKHIKWEDEQSGKLRNYREARKEWQNQMARTEHQVTDYEKQLNEQRVQLDNARQRIFELENELQTLEPTLKQVTENEHRVKQLTQQMLLWEEDTTHMEEQKRYINGLLSQWWSMEELVASLQMENRRLQEEQM
jgi:chromosome segregation ATPase